MRPTVEANRSLGFDETRVQRLLEQFAVDPSDTPAFRTLEEHLFFVEAWQQLAGIYECRISAIEADDPERERLLLRLANVLDERLEDVEGARQRLEELLRDNPEQTEALASLRRLRTRNNELTAALQLAEVEERLPLGAAERARVLAEIAGLWNRVGDATEADRRIEEALQLDPTCDLALAERARQAVANGRNEEALRVNALRVKSLVGAARCEVLAQMVDLLPPEQKDRIRTLLREIVRQFPERVEPLERLIEIEIESRAYERVDELQHLLWRALRSPVERVRLALAAATLQLGEAADLKAASYWADLAEGLAPEDVAVQELRARLFRRAGETASLIDALDKLVRIDGANAMRLLELGVLLEREGEPERAAASLERLLEQEPGNAEALTTLDRCLVALDRHGDRVEVLERKAASAANPAEASDLLFELAQLCRGPLADEAAAEDAYRRALERADHPGAALGLRDLLRSSGRLDALALLLEQLAGRETRKSERAELFSELGQLRLDSLEDPAGARAAFSRALDANPHALEPLVGLRRVADLAGDASALLEACEREVELDPEPERRVALLREIIELARAAGDAPRARRAAEAWNEFETSPESLERLAALGRELGDHNCERAALEGLDTLLAADPPARAAALSRLGELALEQASPNALEAACHWYREALAIAPDDALHCKLIDLYRSSGQTGELAHELRARLSTLDGDEALECRVELARAQRELGELSGVVEELWPLFEQDPARAAVADLLEEVLSEQGRSGELCDLLARRLARERDPQQRRSVGQRLAALLLDGRGRAADAVAVLRELADPSRDDELERLFERALSAAGIPAEREAWLRAREAHVAVDARTELLRSLASLQEQDGRPQQAVQSLRRAHEKALPEERAEIRGQLLALLRGHHPAQEQLELLGELLAETDGPDSRAALRIERARLLADELDAPEAAIQELECAEREAPLGAAELDVVSGLYARAGAVAQQASALGALADATDDQAERRRALLRLSELCLDGPEAARRVDEAEAALRQALALDPGDGEVFDRLLALCDEELRSEDVCELLEARLGLPELRPNERSSLSLRLATLQMELKQPDAAARTVRAARAAGVDRPALNELLYAALETTGKSADRVQLSEERARTESGPDRARWLRRWLDAHAEGAQRPEERLRVVDELLQESPKDPELVALRLPLLRHLGLLEELAAALEDILRGEIPLPAGRRGQCLRELVQLYEGPLDRAERALALIESEADAEPKLRLRAADLALRMGEHAREAALLEPLVRAPEARPGPETVRRLALALCRSGNPAGAEDLLWRAHAQDAGDGEVLAALESVLEKRGDDDGLLQVLEARFVSADSDARASIARRGLALAAAGPHREAELRWVRRLQGLDPLSTHERTRWVELERQVGDRPGALHALHSLRTSAESPEEQAELLAGEAEIQAACGQLGLARDAYAEAVRLSPSPPAIWLRAFEEILKARGEARERARVLRELSRHPDVPEAERRSCEDNRFALLTSDPELCDEAASELEALEEFSADEVSLRIARMRQLLGAYEKLERTSDWCSLAEELAPLLPDAERSRLERRLAARLAHPLCDVERAIAAWEAILVEHPHDASVLGALASLLRRPGAEARLAEVLERWADCGAPDPVECWLEAGELRWHALRDAVGALANANRALECVPDPTAEHALRGVRPESALRSTSRAHTLRSEVSAHLNRSGDEQASLHALLEAEPGDPLAAARWLRLAQITAREPDGESRAREAAKHVLELAQDASPQYQQARAVLERVGAWAEAAEALRHEAAAALRRKDAVAGPDEAAEPLRRLARICWEELQTPAETHRAFEMLSRCASLWPEEHVRWAEALERLERWPEAIAHRRDSLIASEHVKAGAWLELARLILERLDAAQPAREACERALALDPDDVETLELHADLCARSGDASAELEGRTHLADLLDDDRAAARAASRAAHLVRAHTGDSVRAGNLYRSALARDDALLPALLGAGELALEAAEWGEAERRLGKACGLLPESALAERLADTAVGAATAAAQLQRHAEAFRYLEIALGREPRHPAALDAMTELSLRLGAYERARDCLESRMDLPGLDDHARADRLVQLAQAYEGLGQGDEAARTLEEVLSLRPHDEVTRARVVDLLERIGEPERAIAQIEHWIEGSLGEFAPRLELRAARLESSIGRRAQALRRLERLARGESVPSATWVELAELTLSEKGPDHVLALARQGVEQVTSPSERAALLWVQTQALEALSQDEEAAAAACETLSSYPGNVECARLLAAKLSRPIDRERAVEQIERTLDTGNASREVEAELWEAIGRAYSGPLQDIERAQLCYQRALECNPRRSSTREALADTAALDPSSHREAVELHTDLLREFPARPGSWNALWQIAQHWHRDRSRATSELVLVALGLRREQSERRRPRVLVDTGPSPLTAVSDANLVLQVLGASSTPPPREADATLPAPLASELARIAGPLWSLPDAALSDIWREPLADEPPAELHCTRRTRRRLRRTLDRLEQDALARLDPGVWRAEVLAEAAARVFESGQLGLGRLLGALLRSWPETSQLDPRSSESTGSAIQICPPARALLLRIASGVIDGLGLS